MDTLLDTDAAETIRSGRTDDGLLPHPDYVRGQCPQCGDVLVSQVYYIGGRGYLVVWDCWASLGNAPCCTYRKVL